MLILIDLFHNVLCVQIVNELITILLPPPLSSPKGSGGD